MKFHELRHTHATLGLLAGAHPKVMQERLGHANVSITLQTYTHVAAGMQREVAENVASMLAEPEAAATVGKMWASGQVEPAPEDAEIEKAPA